MTRSIVQSEMSELITYSKGTSETSLPEGPPRRKGALWYLWQYFKMGILWAIRPEELERTRLPKLRKSKRAEAP